MKIQTGEKSGMFGAKSGENEGKIGIYTHNLRTKGVL
jgi:hypothetical protein